MNVAREQISVALFNLFANDQALKSLCKTVTRSPRLWTQVNDAEKPFLMLFKGGPATEHMDQAQAQRMALTKYTIYFNLWLYVATDPSGETTAETILNNVADAIDAVMHTDSLAERQTLGGLVNNAWLEGQTEWGREFEDQNVVAFWRIAVETGI